MIASTKKRLLVLLRERLGETFQIDSCTTGGSVSASDLHEIYFRRKETAGDKYTGFDEVLQTLEVQGSAKIKVHDVDCDGKSHIVFTDRKTSQLFGVLVERNRDGTATRQNGFA